MIPPFYNLTVMDSPLNAVQTNGAVKSAPNWLFE